MVAYSFIISILSTKGESNHTWVIFHSSSKPEVEENMYLVSWYDLSAAILLPSLSLSLSLTHTHTHTQKKKKRFLGSSFYKSIAQLHWMRKNGIWFGNVLGSTEILLQFFTVWHSRLPLSWRSTSNWLSVVLCFCISFSALNRKW